MAAKSRKLPMKKRENKKQRSVTFTKRRQGLFNKSAELFIICDAKLAVWVTSVCEKPKQKMFSLGYPSVDAILDAFLENKPLDSIANEARQAAHSILNEVRQLEAELANDNINYKGSMKIFDFEFFEKSQSVKELQDLVDEIEKLIEKVKSRFNNADLENLTFGDSNDFSNFNKHGTSLTINFNDCDLMGLQVSDFGYNNSICSNADNSLPAESASSFIICNDSSKVDKEAAGTGRSFINMGCINQVEEESNSKLDNNNWNFSNYFSSNSNLSSLDVTLEFGNNNGDTSPLECSGDGIGSLIVNINLLQNHNNCAYYDQQRGHGDFSITDDWLWV